MLETFLPYVTTLLGTFALLIFNSIRSEIREIKVNLLHLEKDISASVGKLEHRITVVEVLDRNRRWDDLQKQDML